MCSFLYTCIKAETDKTFRLNGLCSIDTSYIIYYYKGISSCKYHRLNTMSKLKNCFKVLDILCSSKINKLSSAISNGVHPFLSSRGHYRLWFVRIRLATLSPYLSSLPNLNIIMSCCCSILFLFPTTHQNVLPWDANSWKYLNNSPQIADACGKIINYNDSWIPRKGTKVKMAVFDSCVKLRNICCFHCWGLENPQIFWKERLLFLGG